MILKLTNFRDLGGLTGFEGRKIKPKMLLRAGEPVGLCDSDVMALTDEYQLAHLIDFRGEKEISEKPVDDLPGVVYVNIDIMASEMKKNVAPSLEEIVKHLSPGNSDSFMLKAYTDFVISKDALVGYRAFIDALLNAKGALMFHCMAGKDRTGWGAVIILKILGVSDSDIMTDYLLTIEGRKAANQVMIEDLRNKGIEEEKLVIFEEMMSVKPLYLQTAFDAVVTHFESFDHYLEAGLNVTAAEIERLRQLYLEQ